MPYDVPESLILTLGILLVAVLLMLSERLRADLVALLVAVALGATGVLTPQEAFSGFSSSAVITVIAIFMLAEGLRRTGMAERAGNSLIRFAGRREGPLAAITMVAGALLSLFMNNIAAASVLLPAVAAAARKAEVPPSRLLMPLSFATVLGGMATLLTTANIVSSSLLREAGSQGFGLLDFAPLGLPLVGAGVAYMVLWGRKKLPRHAPTAPARAGDEEDLVDTYSLGEELFRARVPEGSYLHGRALADSGFRETYDLHVVAVDRGGRTTQSPPPDFVFLAGDVVHLVGNVGEFRARDVAPHLEILPERTWKEEDLASADVVVVEVMLAPRSRLIGKSLKEAHFRDKYGMNVLAVWRQGEVIRTGLWDLPVRFGDAMLLQGPRSRLELLEEEPGLIVLSDRAEAAPVTGKARVAAAILMATLALAAVFPRMVAEVMFGGALAMVLLGLLTMDQAYRNVNWKTVFLIAGMLPMGLAMSKSGAATLLGEGLVLSMGAYGAVAVLAGLLLLTVLLVQAVNGPAVAAVMVPIAIQAALALEADPRAFTMGVALASSMALMTPLGHPVNVLVMGMGGYRVRDYLRVGFPLTMLLLGMVVALLPVFWPLWPD